MLYTDHTQPLLSDLSHRLLSPLLTSHLIPFVSTIYIYIYTYLYMFILMYLTCTHCREL